MENNSNTKKLNYLKIMEKKNSIEIPDEWLKGEKINYYI